MKSKYKHIITAFVAFVVIVATFSLASYIQYEFQVETLKRAATEDMIKVSAELEGLISEQLYKAKGLGTYYALSPNAPLDSFSKYCELLYSDHNQSIRSLTLIKDTTAFFVWPLKGNEKIIGTDLAQVLAQKETVLKVKTDLKSITVAPVKLIQGGTGIITRMPVANITNENKQQYIGQVSIVLDYDAIFKYSGILDLSSKYYLRVYEASAPVRPRDSKSLSQKNSLKTIFTNSEIPFNNSVKIDIHLPSTDWTLEIVPIKGWQPNRIFLYFYMTLGLITGALSFYYVFSLLQNKVHLNVLVDERTRELIMTNEYLEESMAELEENQAELHLVNDMLEQSLDNLKETQDQLIQSEKFAALGELVAGVAHEINTPLGISITLGTFIQSKHDQLERSFKSGTLNKQEMTDYIESLHESLHVMVNSLNRSAEIIASFKNVAVEQSTLDLRKFNVYNYVNDVLLNLKPKLKKTMHTIVFNCDEALEISSYPGAFSHILTNFVVNSLIHGFENTDNGQIQIDIFKMDDQVHLIYSDNGLGISNDIKDKIFDPFFTTKKGSGSTGLGLHIIHNIVTQVLNGSIHLESNNTSGTKFHISFKEEFLTEDLFED